MIALDSSSKYSLWKKKTHLFYLLSTKNANDLMGQASKKSEPSSGICQSQNEKIYCKGNQWYNSM